MGPYSGKRRTLTRYRARRKGPGARLKSVVPWASGAASPAPQSRCWGWPASRTLRLRRGLAQRAPGSPDARRHVRMLTLLMATLQGSDERNNVCFDRFDNSFKSIVPEPSRQKATPLLRTGTVSLCEVIETCGNNIWFKADSEVLFLNNNNVVFLWCWSCSWE